MTLETKSKLFNAEAPQRLDVFVAGKMPRLSRAFVQKLCENGKVLVNGKPQKAGYKLRGSEVVSIDYDEAELDTVPDIDLPVLYEDKDVIVINKPAGVLTHTQGSWVPEATVASFLRSKVTTLDGDRAGIVHRLDRATSGVMICAKNQVALSKLQKQFAQRKVKKVYVALIEGHLKQKEAIIDMPIERNPKAPATFRAGANGKPARTRYRVLDEKPGLSSVELTPETGRTHQLRVHLTQLGHPIIGDPLYGSGYYGDRLYLHALSLEITLPGGSRQIFTAPLPKEFAERLGQ